MDKELTPAQALSRLYNIAKGNIGAASIAKKKPKPQKKNMGGPIKRKARSKKK
jgi:hypothetical protein